MHESWSYTLHCCLLLVNVRIAYLLGSIFPWVQKYGHNIDTYVKFKNIHLIPVKLHSQMQISPYKFFQLDCKHVLMHAVTKKLCKTSVAVAVALAVFVFFVWLHLFY